MCRCVIHGAVTPGARSAEALTTKAGPVAPLVAVVGADPQQIRGRAALERRARQLRCRHGDRAAGQLCYAADHPLSTRGVRVGVPELVGDHRIVVGIRHIDQATRRNVLEMGRIVVVRTGNRRSIDGGTHVEALPVAPQRAVSGAGLQLVRAGATLKCGVGELRCRHIDGLANRLRRTVYDPVSARGIRGQIPEAGSP